MATLPRSVLVAVDFGDASARAVAVAGLIVQRCGATTLRLLHAEPVEAPAYVFPEHGGELEHQGHTVREQARQFVSYFGREHTTVAFEAMVDDRPAAEAILHESAAADLVVMGTHGRHGLKRLWLGSVAERVLSDSARPLLIARGETTQPVASTFDRVVVHASSRLTGEPTLEYARQLTACFGGEIIDVRHGMIEPTLEKARATLLVAAVPQPRSGVWLSDYGGPLVRYCTVPVLFVPEITVGALP